MSANEDVPPLEDMSELIKQVDALRELKHKEQTRPTQVLQNGHGDSLRTKEKIPEPKEKKETKKKTEQPLTEKSEKSNSAASVESSAPTSKTGQGSGSSTFGGMKKGFLFGGAPKSKSVQENKSIVANKSQGSENVSKQSKTGGNKTLEDIPFVRKNEGVKSEEFRFSEVQEAMEKTNSKLMENKDWVTDDLLSKLEKNEKLAKRLQDPKFIQAIGDFQKNPTEALQKYGNNAEVQEFFKDFCGLMGDHFSKLDDQQGRAGQSSLPSQPKVVTGGGADLQVRSSTNPHQPTAADEAKMQEILSDPEIRDILVDPNIQDLFEHLRKDPEKGQRLLQTATGDLRQKIHRLVQAGLLQFQKT
ncbi:uncharacterized protein LOC123550878 [Mercenaria mercenaria]|uniref:uncharacterized protein LOC123550878 n=1 Tax=Mercenaria mercenaria TaxID=6596 RepID=UPI00234EDA7B|nr:uncharacterized protein LOC123550878 [Mercenaria mercenaria]